MRKRKLEHYCDNIEDVENYEQAKADNFKGWECHHRPETHTSDGERRLVDITMKELKALDMYYHRPSNELVFLTGSERHSLHNKGKPSPNKGKRTSEETKKRISEANKGKMPWNKGKKCEPSSYEKKRKLSEMNKFRHWFNNGIEEVFQFDCPDGYVAGRIK